MCHVLIIEDEALIAQFIAELALEVGATSVAYATTESEAVEAAIATKPCMILSDVRLLEGTGPQAVQAIQRLLGPTPTIFITGTPAECAHVKFAAEVMTKPIAANAFKALFQNLLACPSAAGGGTLKRH